MALIKEPLDVDFEVDPRPLTNIEKEQISNYIKVYKAKHAKQPKTTRKTVAPKKAIA